MDDNELIEIATSLEAETATGKTCIQRCKDDRYLVLTADRAGFLRLAASCLRAAAAPIVDDDCRSKPVEIPGPHDQVLDDNGDSIIDFLQRMEMWPEPKEFIEARKARALKSDRWVLLGCGVLGFVILFLIGAGIAAIAGWFR